MRLKILRHVLEDFIPIMGLKHKKSFNPLVEIEKFVQANKNFPSINWFEYDLAELKDGY
ncbi:hypothetical protein HRM2_15000 [Desulforapulum autotrophicum HRM2]|uniref:Uncharacterized protein n=1 Tax=Desulforapulum autotrophicum (strain ATCC 43914 / DSM 3382 / VKM B-1955 / HRM2) TaxID=177437 RepID=C0Q9P5_DESAH|nr:hypothetical protein [Desulforapulum autotrophicum]ACN14609.1 hypothetical protein HRM2_15000 [Desulforapulum autotrophicum HRM2]